MDLPSLIKMAVSQDQQIGLIQLELTGSTLSCSCRRGPQTSVLKNLSLMFQAFGVFLIAWGGGLRGTMFDRVDLGFMLQALCVSLFGAGVGAAGAQRAMLIMLAKQASQVLRTAFTPASRVHRKPRCSVADTRRPEQHLKHVFGCQNYGRFWWAHYTF